MAYKIQYTDPANSDIDQVLAFIAKDSAPKARKWLEGLIAAVDELAISPESFAVAPEFQDTDLAIRSFHYRSHRVFYEVRGSNIVIQRVWHGARKQLTVDDFE